jgi:hypothetical protein
VLGEVRHYENVSVESPQPVAEGGIPYLQHFETTDLQNRNRPHVPIFIPITLSEGLYNRAYNRSYIYFDVSGFEFRPRNRLTLPEVVVVLCPSQQTNVEKECHK